MNPLPCLRQQLPRDQRIQRHRHAHAYAALVLGGSYCEAGEFGRRWLGPGDVAVHATFATHLNRVGPAGACVLNLPLTHSAESFGRVADPDAVARLAESHVSEAASLLRQLLQPIAAHCFDWPDQLLSDLARDPSLCLSGWAARRGLAAETISRGFRRAFGVTPKRMRFECRARRALHVATTGSLPLAEIALEAGFADQAQMNRAVTDISGRPPGYWRRWSIADKTRGAEAGTLR